MTVFVEEKTKMAETSKKEKKVLPHEYGCEVLLEKTTLERAKDSSFPNDAYLIWYHHNNEDCIDLVRGTRVRIFDMYYDRFGSDAILKIDLDMEEQIPKFGDTNNQKKRKKNE